MSKAQTPSPHASKKHDKRCDSCQSYVSELDPHPVCLKCVPRECNKELPCSHCAPLSLDAWKRWERQQASRKSSSTTKGSKGDSAKGGSKSGKAAAPSGHCPVTPSTSKAESPGKSRLAALESGFSSFRTEIASMFASLQGRLTASHPPGLATEEARHRDGGARGVETCADDPLASQQPCLGLLGPEALPLVGRTPGCDLSDPSHVMEPRGTTNHMAMAMDRGEILKVHGLQFGFGQTGVNQTTQRGRAALTSGDGFEGRGEVSLGTGSSAFTGHQSQPEDAARQPVLVLDSAPSGVSASSGVSALPGVSALSGVSALPGAPGLQGLSALSGVPALSGQSALSVVAHGDTPMEVDMGSAPAGLFSSPAMPDSRSLPLSGISLLPGAQTSFSGVRPPPGFTGTPMGSGEFSGSGQTPAVRQAPPLHFGGTRPLPNRTTATITSCTAPAVTMASYGGVSTSTSLGRPTPSLGIAQNNQVSGPSGQPQQQWSGSIPQGVQLPYTQGTNEIPMEQALNRVFPRGIPAAMEQYLAPNTEPDFGSFRRQSGQSSLDSVISLPELRYDVMARYPGYQVELSDPAPTKPTSLGLANFQQAKPVKDANLPLSPSIEAWLTCQAQAIEGKDRLGKATKVPLGPKAYPKLPSLKAERFEPSNAPSLLRVGQLPPEWHRLVADQGRISPETVSFNRTEFSELQSSVSKMLAILSDLDWWVAGVSNLAKDMQTHLPQDENLQLAGIYSQRYLLESCRSLEELEIQVTSLFTQFKLRERDGYLSRLNPHVPLVTRRELRVSPLVGEYLFDEVLVSQAGDRLQGDVSLKSNTIMLDTLAKRSQAPKARTFPPPKRPAPASTPLVSVKKPKQNPQPAGRGRGKQGKGQFFSGQSAHRGKGRGAKGSGRS